MEKELERVANEISQAINEIRDKAKSLEDKTVSVEARNNELKETIERATKKIDELEIKIKQGNNGGAKVVSEEHKSFMNWLRTGAANEALRPVGSSEQKALVLANNTTGGYLASPEFSQELIRYIFEYSPIRSVATIHRTSQKEFRTRKLVALPTAGLVTESDTRDATTSSPFGGDTINLYEFYAMDDVSRWNLEDSDFNLEQEILSAFGEAIGIREGYYFVNGSGSNQPEGILGNANVGTVLAGSTSAISADNIFTMYFSPKSAYTPRAVWLMNRSTMLAISLLREGSGSGQYLLRQLGESPVWSILGAKVVECPDMPSIANNAYPIVFGDVTRAYLIVDRTDVVVLRDPFTQAASGNVRFWVYKRTGGAVVVPEAIKKLKMATT